MVAPIFTVVEPQGALVRTGFGMDSKPVGKLKNGEKVKALLQKKTPAGITRIRIGGKLAGWVSLTAANGTVLLKVFFIVKVQPARENAALLFLFFAMEHFIPAGVFALVAIFRDYRKLWHGIGRPLRSHRQWRKHGKKSWRDRLLAVTTSKWVWMFVSAGYSSYFMRIIFRDYSTTTGAHVTCMPLLEELVFEGSG